MPEGGRCPECGAGLAREPGLPGLCPQCLLGLALEESPERSSAAASGHRAALTEAESVHTLDHLAAGRILGERYQIRELLGRGGMGEVFRAFDLKLRVDVALKAVRPERLDGERAREQLRQEVRSAREVVSPNVCRIFDLVAEDGHELVSMEFIDGTTLGDTLRQRGPLALQEAREIASQFLSGLEAIHQAGIVHRDFKPENVMLTQAGRVVVMDFGLAKACTTGRTGTIAGTPAYMAPEQARGDPVDARADVFAAAIVLAEMVSVGGPNHAASRQAITRAVRENPPTVPESPWATVLRQALSPIPEERPASARALAHALEEVTQRLPGFETKRPYPGLSSFTEADAEYFFGRELEVEALWRKLRQPRLLALVGPSGAGKSSFLRAGLLPALPRGWKALITTPGSRPFQSLARALAPAFAGDAQAVEALLRFEDKDAVVGLMQRFRQRHDHALLILDQFEELFTLSPRDVQDSFAHLLGRLVLDADLHVILSLRDDFLLRCHDHEALAPAFSDLSPLGPLSESGLRRALVQPALSCGYRFEDEALVDEMVAAVMGERGALPLLAFAASRLWEMRDRDRGLLTSAAYREVGGVAGALAQHAEATLERIGTQRAPIVRELFRNLVTALGTRAVREREELLSMFGSAGTEHTARPAAADPAAPPPPTARSREDAEQVLGALVDARLLTAYERAGEGGESRQQVEIIHESLLTAWPRLVRWQTQDADGAQLRDQLRQAAQLWHDRGRTDDLLWSGTAYQDFALWRQHHPVSLTTAEDAFARAMESNALRRRRRRRAVAAGLVAAAAAVAITTSVLWQRADAARLRAEASKFLALAQLEREADPTAALAWAIESLEAADTQEARLFALDLVQSSPIAILAPMPATDRDGLEAHRPVFSPDGEWLAVGGYRRVRLLDRAGRVSRALGDYPGAGLNVVAPVFGPQGDRVIGARLGDIRAWALSDGRELWRRQGPKGDTYPFEAPDGFGTLTIARPRVFVHDWTPEGAPPRLLGEDEEWPAFDPGRSQLAYRIGGQILLRSFRPWKSPPRLVGTLDADGGDVAISPDGSIVAAGDGRGEIRVWRVAGGGSRLTRVFRAEGTGMLRFDRQGRRLLAFGVQEGAALGRVFDLEAPAGAEPQVLRLADPIAGLGFFNGADFDPSGRWLAGGNGGATSLWALDEGRPHVLKTPGPGAGPNVVAFTPDGRALVVASHGEVAVWPLAGHSTEPKRVLLRAVQSFWGLAIDPSRREAAVAGNGGRVLILPLGGGPPREFKGFSKNAGLFSVVLADQGRLLAAAPIMGPREDKVIRVWDLETGSARAIGPLPGAGEGWVGGTFLRAVGSDQVLAGILHHGLVRVDLRTGSQELVAPGIDRLLAVSPDGKSALACRFDFAGLRCPPVRIDLGSRSIRPIQAHGDRTYAAAFDPSSRLIATGSEDCSVRVGLASGEEPHLLRGHKRPVRAVAFSPDGRWLASASEEDRTIRLWRVPDVTRTPFHKRPHEELMAALRSHTNLRAVRDPQSATGYRLEPGPFPGWAKPPEW